MTVDLDKETTSEALLAQLKRSPAFSVNRNTVILLTLCLSLITSRSAYILISQVFKPGTGFSVWGVADINIPWLMALALSSSFPILLIIWAISSFRNNERRIIIRNFGMRWKVYLKMSVLESVNFTTQAFSLNNLNVVTYTVVKAVSLVSTLVLLRIFTKKRFNEFQYNAVILIIVSIVLIAGSPERSSGQSPILFNMSKYEKNMTEENEIDEDDNFIIGLAASLVGALVLAMMSVVSQRFWDAQETKRDTHDVIESATFQTTGAFLFILPLAVSFESHTWTMIPEALSESGNQVLFSILIVFVCLLQPIMVLSVTAIVSFSSAMATRIVGVVRRVFLIFLGIWLFGETVNKWGQASIVISLCGTALYVYGGKVQLARKNVSKIQDTAEKIETEKNPESPEDVERNIKLV